MAVGLTVPGLIPLVTQLTRPTSFPGQSNSAFLVFLMLSEFALLVVSIIPLLIVRTTIEAKENGLRAQTGTFLHWHEARLFACYQLPDLFPGQGTVTVYELSSPGSVIIWRWICHPQSPFSTWKPLLPVEEYHRQMQALCDLIIEKTGLQLHNLTQLLEEEEANSH